MKSVHLLLGTLIATSTFAIGVRAQETEGPMRCAQNEMTVECDVQVDVADVSNVVLNRGNCSSPVPTEEQKRKAKEYMDSMSQEDKAAMAISPLGFVFTLQQQGKADLVDAIILSNNDPIGSHKFGDQFKFINTCKNLLEYTITVNGEEWTWTTND